MARNYVALPYEYADEMDCLSDEEFGRLCRALIAYSQSGNMPELEGNERFFAKRVMKQEDRFQDSYDSISEVRRAAINARWEKKAAEKAAKADTAAQEDTEAYKGEGDKEESGEYNAIQNDTSTYNAIQRDTNDANACNAMQSDANDANACNAMQSDANVCEAIRKCKTKTETETNTETNTPSATAERSGGAGVVRSRAPMPRPSAEEVREYCQQRGNRVDPQQFVDFYTAKGWKIGSQPMRDWQAAVRTWERRDGGRMQGTSPPSTPDEDAKRLAENRKLFERLSGNRPIYASG